MSKQFVFSMFVLFLMSALIGCGNGNQSLRGTVTFSDDGSPVPVGAIFFTDGKYSSQGAIKENGTYVVGTLKMDDGIPPGEYKVYFGGVANYEEITSADEIMQSKTIPLIDTKYNSAETSGLTFTADGKTKTFDVKLDRAKK